MDANRAHSSSLHSREVSLKLKEVSRLYNHKRKDMYDNMQKTYMSKECTFQPTTYRVRHRASSSGSGRPDKNREPSYMSSLESKVSRILQHSNRKYDEDMEEDEVVLFEAKEQDEMPGRSNSRTEQNATVYERLFKEAAEKNRIKEQKMLKRKLERERLEKEQVDELKRVSKNWSHVAKAKTKKNMKEKPISRPPLYDPTWVAQRSKELQERKQKLDIKECTFQPEINPRSERIAKKLSSPKKAVHDRLYDLAEVRNHPVTEVKLDLSQYCSSTKIAAEEDSTIQEPNADVCLPEAEERVIQLSFAQQHGGLEYADEFSAPSMPGQHEQDRAHWDEPALFDQHHDAPPPQRSQSPYYPESNDTTEMINQGPQEVHERLGTGASRPTLLTAASQTSTRNFESDPLPAVSQSSRRNFDNESDYDSDINGEQDDSDIPIDFESQFRRLRRHGWNVVKTCRRGGPHFSRITADENGFYWATKHGSIKGMQWNNVVNVIKGKRVNAARSNSAFARLSRRLSSASNDHVNHGDESRLLTIICASRDVTLLTSDSSSREKLMAALLYGMGAVPKNLVSRKQDQVSSRRASNQPRPASTRHSTSPPFSPTHPAESFMNISRRPMPIRQNSAPVVFRAHTTPVREFNDHLTPRRQESGRMQMEVQYQADQKEPFEEEEANEGEEAYKGEEAYEGEETYEGEEPRRESLGVERTEIVDTFAPMSPASPSLERIQSFMSVSTVASTLPPPPPSSPHPPSPPLPPTFEENEEYDSHGEDFSASVSSDDDLGLDGLTSDFDDDDVSRALDSLDFES